MAKEKTERNLPISETKYQVAQIQFSEEDIKTLGLNPAKNTQSEVRELIRDKLRLPKTTRSNNAKFGYPKDLIKSVGLNPDDEELTIKQVRDAITAKMMKGK